jgi:hypothetical protein
MDFMKCLPFIDVFSHPFIDGFSLQWMDFMKCLPFIDVFLTIYRWIFIKIDGFHEINQNR